MKPLTYPILRDLGLNETEALVYELLLTRGALEARALVKPSGIGRGNVYNVLVSLEKKGLILSIQGTKTRYQATDPVTLRGLLEQKLQQAAVLETAFQQALPSLSSTFQLATGKPAIQVFEGLEGARQALYASLESKTEILTYFDVRALKGEMAEINNGYLKKRIERGIHKRIIVADTPEAHAFFDAQNSPFTQVVFLKDFLERPESAMEMYDGTVSYITLTEERRISLVIKDANIYALHKQQFEYLWSQSMHTPHQAAKRSEISS